MPYLNQSDYQSPFYLFNGHLQTIIPSLMRKVPQIPYQRKRIETPDDDFLDLDWAFVTPERPAQTLAIISHGLEGDSRRPYVMGMVRALLADGYDVLAWNYRSCSGEMNRQRRFYHMGATDDLHTVITHVLTQHTYGKLVLLGFSAGANITLKYLGEQKTTLSPLIQRAVVFSAPLDVAASSKTLSQPQNFVYERRFLKSLRRKIQMKALLQPGVFDTAPLEKIRRLREFDEAYTAPLHGFRNADDYYQQSSSRNFLSSIAIPTLIVNALNDPFLSPECMDKELVRHTPHVWLQVTPTGGHCGFMHQSLKSVFWSELRALAFLQEENEKRLAI